MGTGAPKFENLVFKNRSFGEFFGVPLSSPLFFRPYLSPLPFPSIHFSCHSLLCPFPPSSTLPFFPFFFPSLAFPFFHSLHSPTCCLWTTTTTFQVVCNPLESHGKPAARQAHSPVYGDEFDHRHSQLAS